MKCTNKCNECNNDVWEGYYIYGNYYCSDECRRKLISDKDWDKLYIDGGENYWSTFYPDED